MYYRHITNGVGALTLCSSVSAGAASRGLIGCHSVFGLVSRPGRGEGNDRSGGAGDDPPQSVSRVLGHCSLATTDAYVRGFCDDEVAAARAGRTG